MDHVRLLPVAHRGLHGPVTPENSVAAVAAAMAAGLAVEVDVRVTADGLAVVHHDRDLRRSCGRPGRVDELPACRVVGVPLLDSDERLPSLAEVLDLVGGRVPLYLDCKTRPLPGQRRAMRAAVASAVRGYRGPLAVVGPDPWLHAGFAATLPWVLRGQSAGYTAPAGTPAALALLAARPLDSFALNRVSRPHFLTFGIARPLTPALLRLRAAGLPVLAWTVTTREQLARLGDQVDNVIVEGDAALAVIERARAAA